jgi:hypothetical protein
MSSLLEYLADTNLTNALSVLRFSGIVSEANGLRIEWQGGMGSWQYLERNNDSSLSHDRWITIYVNSPPTPLQTNLFDLRGTSGAWFYRVRAVRE